MSEPVFVTVMTSVHTVAAALVCTLVSYASWEVPRTYTTGDRGVALGGRSRVRVGGGTARGQADDLAARGMAAAAAIRRHVVTRRHRASSRRCWPRSGDATPAQAHVGAPARPGLWRGVRLAILRRAAWRQRRRSVGTWSRDGIAPARVVAGRAPETPLRPKPTLELQLGPGFGAGSGWRSCGARRGGSGCDPSARGHETAMRELAALLAALRRRYSGPSPHLWSERPATGCCGTGERRSGLGLRRRKLHAKLGGTALTLRLALLRLGSA